jgi:type VI secretion system protein ImpB
MKKPSQPEAKERVNIFFKSKQTPGNAETELPFKLMVMGDFSRSEANDPFENRQSIPVTRDNFNSVMKGMGIKLDMLVDNHLDPEKRNQIPIHLDLTSLRDFEPDQLVANVSQLKELTELRKSLSKAKRLLSGHPQLVEALKTIKQDKKNPNQN